MESQNRKGSPPRTPPSQLNRVVKGKSVAAIGRQAKPRPSVQDVFPDHTAERAVKSADGEHTRNRSNSHDLSWSPNRQRVSVVDNMLMSLDQFSGSMNYYNPDYDTYGDEAAQAASRFNISTPPGTRSRAQTGSSASTDYSLHAADSTPNNKTRSHRSNSSQNFQSSLGRIDSVRRGAEEKEKIPEESPRASHSKSTHPRRSSKGSGSSSVDYGRLAGGGHQRIPGRRSASFDNSYTRPDLIAAITKPTFLPSSDRPTDFYDAMESAPVPAMAGGPRGTDSPNRASATGARPDSSLSAPKRLVRHAPGGKSAVSFLNRRDRSASPHISEAQADKNGRPSNIRHQSDIDKMSGLNTDLEFSDSNGGTGTWSGSAPPSAHPAKEKDKPGFFRRVFGSSRNTSSPSEFSTPQGKNRASETPQVIPARIIDVDAMATQEHQHVIPGNLKDSVRSKRSEKSREQPPLNKKPSFFRRRKKSISENLPVPEPIPQLHSKWKEAAPRPGSASSLRNALDPYLTHEDEARLPEGYTKTSIRAINGNQVAELVVRDSPNSKHRSKNSRDLKISTDANTLQNDNRSSRAPLVGYVSNGPAHQRTLSDTDKALPGLPANNKGKENQRISSTAGIHHREGSDKVNAKKRSSKSGEKMDRLWLLPNDSGEDITVLPPRAPNSTPNPLKAIEGAPKKSTSDDSDYKTADSEKNSPALAPTGSPEVVPEEAIADEPGPALDAGRANETDRELATKLLNGDLGIDFAGAATWLGDEGPERAGVRRAFMELFDWQNMSILSALRSFCRQVKLMAETQQLDRVLDSLSQRWCECNPRHGFKATDVVHTICFSIVLLNTDLHMADIEQKMTRSQFVKNTLPTLLRVVTDAAPDSFDPNRSSMLPPPRPPPQIPDDTQSASMTLTPGLRRPGMMNRRPSHQSDIDSPSPIVSAMPIESEQSEDCGPLVNFPFNGKQAAWELQIEVVLKNFYNSIRQDRLPLHHSETRPTAQAHPSSVSLSGVGGGSLLRRSNSMISKAGSEMLPPRGRMMDPRASNKWASKPRSRGRFYPASLARSSRTSFDDDASAVSPSVSSLWSRASFSKTGTSMSVHSMSSAFPTGDYQQSIGFANALSRTIIREEASAADEESLRMKPLLEDESLELAGSPWAKEGIVKHKHHLESVDKKARDRNWVECFAVIEKGWMRLFQFNSNSKTMRSKARSRQISGGVVGGGNWTENAEPLGSYLLRQSIASALPPPGYSKARPHVWALSLPNGAVHLFQAGTPDIVKEFVGSANYWSARMSKEPLVGGVSNVEYGWSDAVCNLALSQENRPSSAAQGPRPSFQASIRSSIDQSHAARPRIPGDRINISDWAAPAQSMMPSQLMEVDQLKALTNYVKNVEQELKRHNELRAPMQLAFTPRHPNGIKAMTNWEKKSAYLLHEIVKFSKYAESLGAAHTQAEKVYAEREEHEKLKDAAAEALGRGEIPGDSSDDIAVA